MLTATFTDFGRLKFKNKTYNAIPSQKSKGEKLMSVQQLNYEMFNDLKGQNKTILLDFYADWCHPCKMLSPVIEEIASERTDIIVAKVNVDMQEKLASLFEISSIPTLAVIKNGKETQRSVGVIPKSQILQMLEN